MKLNAVIIGNYGATNLGDEAILSNILVAHPEVNFTVFSHNPELTSENYKITSTYPLPFGIRSLFRGNFRKSLSALKKTDFVIIGGGGLFTDEKIKAVLLWGWHFFWAKFYKKPVFIYANSIGPLNSKIGKFISKKVFQKADFITVRDEESAEILKEFKIKNFEITADPAFLSPPLKEKTRKKQIAISLRNWIKHEDDYISVLKDSVQSLEKMGYHVLLISMQNFQDDDRNILNKIASDKTLLITPRNFEELIKILNQCEFTIGMRLHFLIASALANTPFIALSYSQKTDSLAKNLEMTNYLLPLAKITSKLLDNLINKTIKDQKEIQKKLIRNIIKEEKNAQKNILMLKKFIAKNLGKS